MNVGLLLSEDLIFISRIAGTAQLLGLTLKSKRTPADLLRAAAAEAPACVLLDLNHPGLAIDEVVAALKSCGTPYLVGYGSHVDAATLKRAREAGTDLVLPRSKFVEELPTELAGWFAKGGK